ncbi:MAG TPA: hypothetical protein P5121_20460 [Caldilineaceae bacterium]|nr:hypothetical protein [Caldilineaceae bacterium]
MAKLFVKETGAQLPATDEQIQFLIDHLEEESYDDQDYYLNTPMVDLLEREGADPALIQVLRDTIGQRDGVEVVWEGRAPVKR